MFFDLVFCVQVVSAVLLACAVVEQCVLLAVMGQVRGGGVWQFGRGKLVDDFFLARAH